MIAWIERKLRKSILVNLICIFVIFRTDNYMNFESYFRIFPHPGNFAP